MSCARVLLRASASEQFHSPAPASPGPAPSADPFSGEGALSSWCPASLAPDTAPPETMGATSSPQPYFHSLPSPCIGYNNVRTHTSTRVCTHTSLRPTGAGEGSMAEGLGHHLTSRSLSTDHMHVH